MSFLKTTKNSPQYNALHGFSNNPHHRLQLVEDANDDWFIHEGIKKYPQYKHLKTHLNKMQKVETIDFKESSSV